MELNFGCKPRYIRKVDVVTPLLVPAFSSAATGNIGEVHEQLKEQILTASLISAYDLHYKIIKSNKIWWSEVVFIDSGAYEKDQLAPLKSSKDWSLQQYQGVVDRLLPPKTKIVLISYDKYSSIQNQIRSARKFFERYENQSIDFLCKPPKKSSGFIDIIDLTRNVADLEYFDILGVTEKELGNSVLNRCKNLLTIRRALDAAGLQTPIHVFGCIDILGTLAYFLCGADIFDGLAWLKYSFQDDKAVYVNNHTILSGSWARPDSTVWATVYVLNLRKIDKLMRQMQHFARTNDIDDLELNQSTSKELKDLRNHAGHEK